MNIKSYLKSYSIHYCIALFFLIVLIIFSIAFEVPVSFIRLLILVYLLVILFISLFDYYRKYQFYHQLENNLSKLDQKYLITETLEEPSFIEGKIIYESLYTIDKSMKERINDFENESNDFKEYIEMWIHEVKLPIASLLLKAHNQNDSKYIAQLNHLDTLTEQVLYYIRANHASNDYLIKEVDLSNIIHESIIRNKEDLLDKNIELNIHDNQVQVLTDSKWLSFILHQIITNSIKYDCTQLEIYTEECKDCYRIHIKDNGIGIIASDLPKVFDKSFTGYNGHTHSKSTGMGLYICKKLCSQMGHRISIDSKVNEYTEVIISIGKDEYYSL